MGYVIYYANCAYVTSKDPIEFQSNVHVCIYSNQVMAIPYLAILINIEAFLFVSHVQRQRP